MAGALPLEQLEPVGHGLHRPECVLCTADGSVFVPNWSGGVDRIHPDGVIQTLLAINNSHDVRPNGIALLPDGTFLLANLGDTGGVWHLDRRGHLRSYLAEVGGRRLPPANFVLPDTQGRLWVSVSTRREPRALGYRPDVADGFIVLLTNGKAHIVADALGYTNELQLDTTGQWLYANETFGRRLSRFPVAGDGSLGPRETVCTFGIGTYPDGLCFDEEGCAWITSIVSNRVLRISPDGEQQVMIEDVDDDHLEMVEQAFMAGEMDRPHLDVAHGEKLRNISSMAFGGPGRDIGYLGCLLDERIWRFNPKVKGVQPAHWHWHD